MDVDFKKFFPSSHFKINEIGVCLAFDSVLKSRKYCIVGNVRTQEVSK